MGKKKKKTSETSGFTKNDRKLIDSFQNKTVHRTKLMPILSSAMIRRGVLTAILDAGTLDKTDERYE